MRSKTTPAALAAVALLGLGTGCEKQSPWVTMTAGGVVVKARAIEYCRDGETGDECNRSSDVPTLTVRAGDTLGIDVPRSVAEQGWLVSESPQGGQGPYSNDHYRSIEIPAQIQPGSEQPLYIHRNAEHGVGRWQFMLQVR